MDASDPHVAAEVIISEFRRRTFQPCALCGAPLLSVVTGSGDVAAWYATGECVGRGCAGHDGRTR